MRKASGMEPSKFLGKIYVVKNEGDDQRQAIFSVDGTIIKHNNSNLGKNHSS